MTLPADKEMVLPGDNVKMDVELIQPIAMDQGLRFAIREGGRTVGAGVVSAIKSKTCPHQARPRQGRPIRGGLFSWGAGNLQHSATLPEISAKLLQGLLANTSA